MAKAQNSLPIETATVTVLRINTLAFELIAKANYRMSIELKKQITFQQLISKMLDDLPTIDNTAVNAFDSLLPIDGNIKVHIKLARSKLERLREFMREAASYSNSTWQRRDALIFLCYLATQKTA